MPNQFRPVRRTSLPAASTILLPLVCRNCRGPVFWVVVVVGAGPRAATVGARLGLTDVGVGWVGGGVEGAARALGVAGTGLGTAVAGGGGEVFSISGDMDWHALRASVPIGAATPHQVRN